MPDRELQRASGAPEGAVDEAFAMAGAPRRVAVRAAHAMGVTYILASTDLLVVVPSRLAAAGLGQLAACVLAPADTPRDGTDGRPRRRQLDRAQPARLTHGLGAHGFELRA
jgi:hypothetical protein